MFFFLSLLLLLLLQSTTIIAYTTTPNGVKLAACFGSSKKIIIPSQTLSPSHEPPTMRVSRRGSKLVGQDNTITSTSEQLKTTAGRPGSKNFVDPCKVFIGNIPYTATDGELWDWLSKVIDRGRLVGKGTDAGAGENGSGVVVRDWRTGESKGYGFLTFTDPVYAASACELLKGKKFMKRILRFSQGRRKKAEPIVQIRMTRKEELADMDDEDLIAYKAAEEVNAMGVDGDGDDSDGDGDSDFVRVMSDEINENESPTLTKDEQFDLNFDAFFRSKKRRPLQEQVKALDAASANGGKDSSNDDDEEVFDGDEGDESLSPRFGGFGDLVDGDVVVGEDGLPIN